MLHECGKTEGWVLDWFGGRGLHEEKGVLGRTSMAETKWVGEKPGTDGAEKRFAVVSA